MWFKFLNNFPLVFQNAYINLCSNQQIREDSTLSIVSTGLVLFFFFNHPRVIFDSFNYVDHFIKKVLLLYM